MQRLSDLLSQVIKVFSNECQRCFGDSLSRSIGGILRKQTTKNDSKIGSGRQPNQRHP